MSGIHTQNKTDVYLQIKVAWKIAPLDLAPVARNVGKEAFSEQGKTK